MKARRNYGLCDWFSWTDLSAVSLVRGGGLVLLPAMVSFLKVDDYKARGTTLATIFIATLVAAIFYSREIKFSFVEILPLMIGGMLGGYIGAKLTNKLPKEILNVVFNLFLIFVAVRILMGK